MNVCVARIERVEDSTDRIGCLAGIRCGEAFHATELSLEILCDC
jgi:hypothetical protein